MMKSLDHATILFAAGGTAGHINPALATAGFLRYLHPDANLHFVGTADHMEAQLVPDAGIPFHTIDISGFQRKPSLENLKRNFDTIKRLLRVSGAVHQLLTTLQPDLVMGFGGYVSGPVLRSAAKAHHPTIIHEQNAFPGLTNRALAGRVDRVLLATPDAAERLRCKHPPIHTGLPLRRELLHAQREVSRRELCLDDRPLVLSMGGSLGARTLNEAIAELLVRVCSSKQPVPFHLHHAYGRYGAWLPELLSSKKIDLQRPELQLCEYICDVPRRLAAADLVICRAGASSVAEIAARGVPSILIPSPNVAENHQYYNAKTLSDAGAAVLIEEKTLTPELLTETVQALLNDPERRKQMQQAAQSLAVTDANERIYTAMTELLCTSI